MKMFKMCETVNLDVSQELQNVGVSLKKLQYFLTNDKNWTCKK